MHICLVSCVFWIPEFFICLCQQTTIFFLTPTECHFSNIYNINVNMVTWLVIKLQGPKKKSATMLYSTGFYSIFCFAFNSFFIFPVVFLSSIAEAREKDWTEKVSENIDQTYFRPDQDLVAFVLELHICLYNVTHTFVMLQASTHIFLVCYSC